MVTGIVYKLIRVVSLVNILFNICNSDKAKFSDSYPLFFPPEAPCLGPDLEIDASMRAFLHVSTYVGKPAIGFYVEKVDTFLCINVKANIKINTLGMSHVLS